MGNNFFIIPAFLMISGFFWDRFATLAVRAGAPPTGYVALLKILGFLVSAASILFVVFVFFTSGSSMGMTALGGVAAGLLLGAVVPLPTAIMHIVSYGLTGYSIFIFFSKVI